MRHGHLPRYIQVGLCLACIEAGVHLQKREPAGCGRRLLRETQLGFHEVGLVLPQAQQTKNHKTAGRDFEAGHLVTIADGSEKVSGERCDWVVLRQGVATK